MYVSKLKAARFTILFAVLAFALFAGSSVAAHGLVQETNPVGSFGLLFSQYLALAGVGSAVAAVVSALKAVKVITGGRIVLVPDGYSDNVQALINVVLFVIFVATKTLHPAFDFSGVDAQARQLANFATQLIGLLIQMASATLAYQNVLRGKFLIGTSYSE